MTNILQMEKIAMLTEQAMKFADAHKFSDYQLAHVVGAFYNMGIAITPDMNGMYWEDALIKALEEEEPEE